MKTRLAMLAGVLMLSAAPFAAYAEEGAESNVMFIFDSSGSMKKQIASGESRAEAAKRAMVAALGAMPPDARLGLIMYGHRRANECTDIELISPIGTADGVAIAQTILGSQPKGETPIAASLEQAARSFAPMAGQSNSIVLVTDGIEECGGDPCAAARAIREAGLGLKAHVVGFTLNDQQRQTVQCIADETGGKYFDAQDSDGLAGALAEVKKEVVEPVLNQPIPVVSENPVDLLSPRNGGALTAAPNDEWMKLNDGKPDLADIYGGEGVWSFKDGQAATFNRFEMLIPRKDQYNVRKFQLLVGNDGPDGAFTSIGTFQTQNTKLMQTPYQPFEFTAVTAKFIKVVVTDSWGSPGNISWGFDFRLIGDTHDAAAENAAVQTPSQDESSQPTSIGVADPVDLLAPANGGALVAAPNDEWMKLNDGKSDRAGIHGGEGIWSFKDGKPATFNRFEMLIPGKEQYNAREFELFVGNDGPDGVFTSIGTFETKNIKLMQTPYQPFEFAPVTAKFIKVVLKNSWDSPGNIVWGYDFRLIGTVQ